MFPKNHSPLLRVVVHGWLFPDLVFFWRGGCGTANLIFMGAGIFLKVVLREAVSMTLILRTHLLSFRDVGMDRGRNGSGMKGGGGLEGGRMARGRGGRIAGGRENGWREGGWLEGGREFHLSIFREGYWGRSRRGSLEGTQ